MSLPNSRAHYQAIEVSFQEGEQERRLSCGKILLAVGRQARTQGLFVSPSLQEELLPLQAGSIVTTDYYQVKGSQTLYAIGDVRHESPMLAHVASGEAEIAVEHMKSRLDSSYVLNLPQRLDPHSLPFAIYTEPQLATFGMTEQELKAKELNYGTAKFPFSALGKAVASKKSEGLIKIFFAQDTHEILGAQTLGAMASEIIHEFLLAKSTELVLEDLAHLIHMHPTFSEIGGEVSKLALGRPLHY